MAGSGEKWGTLSHWYSSDWCSQRWRVEGWGGTQNQPSRPRAAYWDREGAQSPGLDRLNAGLNSSHGCQTDTCRSESSHIHAHAHTHKDVQAHTGTHVYLSSSCLERPPPKPIPLGVVLNKKRVWLTLSEFKIPSWQHEPQCVFRLEKTNSINSIFYVSLFPLSLDNTIGTTPGKTLNHSPFGCRLFSQLNFKLKLKHMSRQFGEYTN